MKYVTKNYRFNITIKIVGATLVVAPVYNYYTKIVRKKT
jgi:hypothetical protein